LVEEFNYVLADGSEVSFLAHCGGDKKIYGTVYVDKKRELMKI